MTSDQWLVPDHRAQLLGGDIPIHFEGRVSPNVSFVTRIEANDRLPLVHMWIGCQRKIEHTCKRSQSTFRSRSTRAEVICELGNTIEIGLACAPCESFGQSLDSACKVNTHSTFEQGSLQSRAPRMADDISFDVDRRRSFDDDSQRATARFGEPPLLLASDEHGTHGVSQESEFTQCASVCDAMESSFKSRTHREGEVLTDGRGTERAEWPDRVVSPNDPVDKALLCQAMQRIGRGSGRGPSDPQGILEAEFGAPFSHERVHKFELTGHGTSKGQYRIYSL